MASSGGDEPAPGGGGGGPNGGSHVPPAAAAAAAALPIPAAAAPAAAPAATATAGSGSAGRISLALPVGKKRRKRKRPAVRTSTLQSGGNSSDGGSSDNNDAGGGSESDEYASDDNHSAASNSAGAASASSVAVTSTVQNQNQCQAKEIARDRDDGGSGSGEAETQARKAMAGSSGQHMDNDNALHGGAGAKTAGSVHEMMQRVADQQLVANARHNHQQQQGGDLYDHSAEEDHLGPASSMDSTDGADSDSSSPLTNDNNSSNDQQDQPPDGWRVKLYRLNPDGTWDDCGTGRIVCLIHGRHDGPPYQKKRRLSSGAGGTSTDGGESDTSTRSSGDIDTTDGAATAAAAAGAAATDPPTTLEGLYYSHLGEPTLLMRSEAHHHHHPHVGGGHHESLTVLLRTRVLLSGDAYQRQGENIITWSEPCFGDEGSESGASSCSDAESASDTSDSEGEYGGSSGGAGAGAGGGGAGGSGAGIGSSLARVSPLSKSAEEGGLSGAASADDEEPPPGVDLALSFQDNAGCLDIWSKITNVQSRAMEIVNHHNLHGGRPGIARGLLDHHRHGHHSHGHAGAQRSPLLDGMDVEEQLGHIGDRQPPSPLDALADEAEAQSDDVVSKLAAAAAAAQAEPGDILDRDSPSPGAHMDHVFALASMAEMGDEVDGISLPPPTSENLPTITTTLSTVPLPSQRESYAIFLSQNECAYLRNLLSLFNPAEQRGDFPTLATLAACVKTVLLLNDAAIIEPIIEFGPLFEDVCAALEYDPDLRTKARHRHFLRNCTKFRTVIQMDEREGGPDRELIEAIFRSFRVNYLRDTILRPTMDESSLSTLSSLGSFISTDVVRGVMVPPGEGIDVSYLSRVLQVLAIELIEVRKLEHKRAKDNGGILPPLMRNGAMLPTPAPTGPWAQHLSPQDSSLASRRTRRSDCLRFLRELFSMVRENLQQSDRDDFFETMCIMEVPLGLRGTDQSVAEITQMDSEDDDGIKLLSLLGCILSDPNAMVSEKAAVLEIVSSIAVHDPCLVRRHCLEELQKDLPSRPTPDNNSMVSFVHRKPDLLLSLLSSLAVEVDAGLLLQVSEVLRIVLDTDMAHTDMAGGELNGFGASSGGGGGSSLLDVGPGGSVQGDADTGSASSGHGGAMVGMALDDFSDNPPQGSVESAIKEENRFLSLFYEFYVAWLVAPFQYTILMPSVAPLLTDSAQFASQQSEVESVTIKTVPPCAVRASFAIEILSFCVRAHVYRMKFYVLRSRVLGTILGLLGPNANATGSSRRAYSSPRSVDRCLKLSALRFLRSVLSVRDEFYHRHIIQQNLFKPVFDAFRENPVGDNLVSSAVIEMCDYIRIENIRSLVEYVATKHLGGQDDGTNDDNNKNKAGNIHRRRVSLEEVAAPHTDTLEQLRQKYEENLLTVGGGSNAGVRGQDGTMDENQPPRSRYFDNDEGSGSNASGPMGARVPMNERARDDQRKYREIEAEEAFFAEGDDDDDEDDVSPSASVQDMRVIRPSGVASPPPPSGAVSSALPPALPQLQELESHRAAALSTAATAAAEEDSNDGEMGTH